TPVEPIVVEQQSQTVPKPEQVPAEPVAEVAEPDVASVPAKAQPKGYVVQLAALSNQAAVNRFIDEQQLSRQALAWHRTYSQGRHWYVVTTEPVGSHVEALATAGRLEGAHPGLATWVRSLQSLQQAMEDTSGR
ncbi:MAG: SPOR domain-containing protein, partial [Porticoccaceae bacterium]|nr:SPOR domain-containing protein [Porticoccaceae bacterium]